MGSTSSSLPNHSIPQVTVDVWYHVGSKNEVPGRTGFAHLFEHVMFTGSGHVPYGLHDKLTEGVGGNNNGSTNNDRTNYYETVPANYLESALWLEADRMGFLLDKLDQAKFAAQRDIVQNERRQGIDNQPYGRAFEITTTAMYPQSNPYSWPVVGYMADLQKATVDDVKDFFRLYYAPNNATLAIVGDFDPAQAKAWIKKYFGDLPRGRQITRPVVPPTTLANEKRLVYEDRVQIPRLYVQWPTVGATNDDDLVLQISGAILSGPRTARLTKALVYDRQSAATAQAGSNSSESTRGDFVVHSHAAPRTHPGRARGAGRLRCSPRSSATDRRRKRCRRHWRGSSFALWEASSPTSARPTCSTVDSSFTAIRNTSRRSMRGSSHSPRPT